MQLFLLLPPSTSLKPQEEANQKSCRGGEEDLAGEATADTRERNALLGTPLKKVVSCSLHIPHSQWAEVASAVLDTWAELRWAGKHELNQTKLSWVCHLIHAGYVQGLWSQTGWALNLVPMKYLVGEPRGSSLRQAQTLAFSSSLCSLCPARGGSRGSVLITHPAGSVSSQAPWEGREALPWQEASAKLWAQQGLFQLPHSNPVRDQPLLLSAQHHQQQGWKGQMLRKCCLKLKYRLKCSQEAWEK